MQKFIVKGGRKLSGNTSVFGSKNVALKAIVASCLTNEEVVIKNIPLISDFMVMTEIIGEIGGRVSIIGHTAKIRLEKIKKQNFTRECGFNKDIFYVPRTASFRERKAIIPNPGGCRIGARPIDRVIKGIKKMGVKVSYNRKDGFFHLSTLGVLNPVSYKFDKNTHTGTETMILLSVLVKGKTILENTALEPEVDDLIEILNSMGADIKRTGKRRVEINGVDKLHGAEITIPPDRNEVVTLAIAAIITKGDIFIENISIRGLEEFIEVFKKAGGGIEIRDLGIRFYYAGKIKALDITTTFYPGFMTDWQGPWVIMMTQAEGVSVVHETVYENRFNYVAELEKMGAEIELFNPQVKDPEKFYNFNYEDNKPEYKHAVRISGPSSLHNAVINISDLRAGATLVLAALAAGGESIIFGVEHLDRGYEKFEKRLRALGANIKRDEE